jgi:vacuolar-type H+-ATPase subunit C/Vma6
MSGYTTVYPPGGTMSVKNVGIRIRVERELRDAFQQACAAENRQASDLLREFMRSFSVQNINGLQSSLFSASEPLPTYDIGNAGLVGSDVTASRGRGTK